MQDWRAAHRPTRYRVVVLTPPVRLLSAEVIMFRASLECAADF